MSDLWFIASVAAVLLTSGTAAQRAWAGRGQLRALALTRLAGNAPALAILASDAAEPEAWSLLAQAILAASRADAVFAAAVRQLVVDAYADPDVARGLPDPAPELD